VRPALALVAALLAAPAVSAGPAAAGRVASCHALRTCPANHYEYAWRGLRCAMPRLADSAKDPITVRWHGSRWLCHRPAAPAPLAPGSRGNPYPLGASASVAGGRWTLRIDSVKPDATQEILDANPLGDPPAAGRQFFMVHVTAVFNGPGTTVAWQDLLSALDAVGGSQLAYTQTSTGNCGALPSDIADVEDVFPGATVTGNVCWSVTAPDASTLLVYWLDGATQQPSVWFATR
jgi:hypothetical protein